MLGVLDWGIGGLGLVCALRARHGHTPPLLYASDAGAPPYGTLSPEALARRVAQVVSGLHAQGATSVIVACNAASTALPLDDPPCPVRGVIAPGVQAALQFPGTIAVIGGVRTIQAGRHAAALRAAGRTVRPQVAQPLSALVERGRLRGPAVEAAVDAVLQPVAEADVLLLACTHYPALSPLIRARYPHLTLVDPVDVLAAEIPPGAPGPMRVATSGDPDATRAAAAAAWGLRLGEIEPAWWT